MSKYQARLDYPKIANNGRPLWQPGAYRVDPTDPTHSRKKIINLQSQSEVGRYASFKMGEEPQPQISPLDFPRNLNTYDIPGAIPNSKAVKQLAMARGRDLEPKRDEAYSDPIAQTSNNRAQEDSLDRFAREYQPQRRRNSRMNFEKLMQQDREANSIQKENHQLRSSYIGDLAINNHQANKEASPQYYDPSPITYSSKILKPEILSSQINQAQDVEYSPSPVQKYNELRNPEFFNSYDRSPKEKITPIIPNNEVSKPQEQERPNLQSRASLDIGRIYESRSVPKTNPNIEPRKIYTYNIIAHRPIPLDVPAKSRLPFKYAMEFDPNRVQNRSLQPSPLPDFQGYGSVSAQRDAYKGYPDTQRERTQNDTEGTYGGNSNEYGAEPNYRYGSKPSRQQQDTGSDNQYVNSKVLKNLSGLKIY